MVVACAVLPNEGRVIVLGQNKCKPKIFLTILVLIRSTGKSIRTQFCVLRKKWEMRQNPLMSRDVAIPKKSKIKSSEINVYEKDNPKNNRNV